MANKNFVVKNGLTASSVDFVDDITSPTTTVTATVDSNGTLSFTGKVSANTRSDLSVTATSGTVELDFNYNNFYINVTGAITGWTLTNAATNIGATGTIVIRPNGQTMTDNLPTAFKTPNGDSIVFKTTGLGAINYFVVSETEIICNYMGNFQ